MVRLDYCNALLCGAREDVIRQLERLQRQAARVVCKKYKNDHTSVTELMWGLHWLPIRGRIQYKILLIVYKAFTNGSPTYLADMMTSCNPVRSTRSSHKVNSLPRKQLGTKRYHLDSDLSGSVVPHRHDISSRTDSLKVTVLVWKTVPFECRQRSRLAPTRQHLSVKIFRIYFEKIYMYN